MATATETLRAAREKVVREHMDAENRHDVGATVATFGHPRYEVVPTGEVRDGPDAVRGFHAEIVKAFPDLAIETHALHHGDSTVVAEVTFSGTQTGSWRGLPATGRRVAYKMCNVFVFEGEKLVCERLYFDMLTPLKQVGIARDPLSITGRIATVLNHPLTIARAVARTVRGR